MNITSNLTNVIVFSAGEISFIAIAAVSLFTSLLNVVVFAHPNLKDPTYKFLLVTSLLDIVYLVLAVFAYVYLKCCGETHAICGAPHQRTSQYMYILLMNYVTSCLAIYSVCTEIFLTVQRLNMIRKVRFLADLKIAKVGPFIGFFSIVFYLPVWLLEEVKPIGTVFYVDLNQSYTEYGIVRTPFGETEFGKSLWHVMSGFRMFLTVTVLTVLNVITIVSFRSFLAKKSKIVSSKASNFFLFFHFTITSELALSHQLLKRLRSFKEVKVF
jgi:hypothetical protein